MKTLAAIFIICSCIVVHAQEPVNAGLTAVYDAARNIVKLKWQQNDAGVTRFILQRSSDNDFFTDVANLNITSANRGKFISFADERVGSGKNYYRLKIFSALNNIRFSGTIMVIIGKPGNSWIMYPVPVSTVLYLQYNGSESITGVISVIIQSVSSGQILCRLRVASTTRLIQIPVSNLGRGVYDVRIYIADRVVWNRRFIK